MKKSVWYIFIVLSGFLFIHSSVVPASGQSNIVSDDFFASSLNTSIWTYINPLGDSTLTATGTQVSISVPAGTSHDVSTGGNRAPRIMQQANNTDFEVEVKFDSGVSAQYQMQGLIIEQDSSNYLRFDFYSTTSETRIFAQSFTNGSAAVKNNSVIGGIPSSIPLYMRVNRQGNVWTQSYSFNGADWTSAVVFTRTLNVTKAGPFAANHGIPGSSSPGFTCLVDYFFNTASPIVPEDGGTSAPTVINLWYGDYQRFGHIGNPQNWVNILGDVSDLDGIASLKYSLNGGPEMPLSIGPDTRRLAAQGDFNVEIAYTDLLCGLNQVTITATDTLGNTAVKTVDVEYTCGQTWPETYSINWGSIANIQDAAQVVDGKWTLETDSLHMAVQDGASLVASYDRLVAIGDVSWDDYEITAPITINTLSTSPVNSGTFVGLVMRWQGHYDWDGGQPRNGWYPLGAIGVYDFVYNYGTQIGDFRLRIVGNNSTAIAEDMSGRHLQVDVRYMFKMRVETSGTSSAYYFKVWEDGTSEPSGWDISGMGLQGELKNGSVVLVAHQVDANFGNVAITPGPFIDSPPVLSNIQAEEGTYSAEISWLTNKPSTSSVSFGLSTAYENGSIQDSAMVTNHTITLTGLNPETLYHYRITSVDASGNSSSSSDITFTTNPGVSGGQKAIYSFDEGSGTISNDLSGNGNNGTINGAAWTTGKTGSGLSFDGINDYVEASHSNSLNITNNKITLSALVYYIDNEQAQMIIAKPYSSITHASPYFSYAIHVLNGVGTTDGTPRFWLTINGVGKYAISSVKIAQNQWNHIAGVYDGSTMKIYVNGVQSGITSVTGNITGYNTPLRIGTNGGLTEAWKGKIDEVGIYNIALTSLEIMDLYKSPLRVANFSASDNQYSQVTLSWTNPSDTDLAEVVVQRNVGSYPSGHTNGVNVYTNNSPAVGVPVNFADTGVSTDVIYYYAVFSKNTAGSWNDTVTAGKNADTGIALVSPDTTPPTISNIQLSSGEVGAIITWDTNEPSTSRVDYGTTTAYGGFVEDAMLVTSHTVEIGALSPGTEYHYKVTSSDGSGNGASSLDQTFTTTNVIPPSKVIGFTASDTQYSQVTLGWTNPSDSDLAEVVVQRKEGSYPAGHADGVNVYTNSSPAAGVPVNAADTGVINDVTYYYAVFSRDTALNWNDTVTAGQNADTGVSLVTPDTTPPVISSIQAAPGDTGAAITWDTDEAATSRVDYGTTTAYGSFVESATPVTAHTVALSVLMPGTEYHYKVTSSDGSGNGASSLDLTFTTSSSSVLKAFYTFNEGTGITANDSSGNGNTGLINGATWTTGKSGGGLSFDGINDYVEASHSNSLNITDNKITLSAWVYYADNENHQIIIAKPYSSTTHASPYFSYGLQVLNGVGTTDGTPRFWLTINGVGKDATSSVKIAQNQWSHVTGVYDGSVMKIYINGVQRGTTSVTGNVTGYNTPLRVGTNGGLTQVWKGILDDVRIYNKALSDQEVQDLYTQYTPPSQVTDFTASDNQYAKITLDWTNPSDSDPAEVVVQRKEGGYPADHTDGVNVYTNTSPTAGGPVNAADTGVINDVTYYYAVFSRDTAMNWNDTVTAGQNADTGKSRRKGRK